MHVVLTLIKINPAKIDHEEFTSDAILIEAMMAETSMRIPEFFAVSPLMVTHLGSYMMMIDAHDCPKGRI